MGVLNDKCLQAANKNSDGRYCYVGEYNATQISCSGFAKQNMYEAGAITKKERDTHDSFWAGDRNMGIFLDTRRFKRHEVTETPKDGWFQWFDGHISQYYKNGCYEACPKDSHYLATNGKTAVGYFAKNHNCSGGRLICYFEILDPQKITTEQIEKAITWAINTANDNSHGYSNKVDHNLGNPDYDCGTFVSAALRYANILGSGVILEPNSPTGVNGYDVILTSAGYTKMKFVYSEVKRGDILIRDGHHVEMALGNGKQIGAHDNYDNRTGDGSGREISEVNLSTNWTYMYRPSTTPHPTEEGGFDMAKLTVLHKGKKGAEVLSMQVLLNAKGGFKLDLDGSFGPATDNALRAYQKTKGLEVDGYCGPITWQNLLQK